MAHLAGVHEGHMWPKPAVESYMVCMMIGKLRNSTTVIITPDVGYSGKGQMTWSLDLYSCCWALVTP